MNYSSITHTVSKRERAGDPAPDTRRQTLSRHSAPDALSVRQSKHRSVRFRTFEMRSVRFRTMRNVRFTFSADCSDA